MIISISIAPRIRVEHHWGEHFRNSAYRSTQLPLLNHILPEKPRRVFVLLYRIMRDLRSQSVNKLRNEENNTSDYNTLTRGTFRILAQQTSVQQLSSNCHVPGRATFKGIKKE